MYFSFIYFIFCNDHFENKIWCMYFLYNQQGSSLAKKKLIFYDTNVLFGKKEREIRWIKKKDAWK